MLDLYHKLILFPQSMNCVHYVPEKQFRGDILVWTLSRSKIDLYFLVLHSIISNGENFNFECQFCFMLSHLTMIAIPCADFYRASTCICKIASSYRAEKRGLSLLLSPFHPQSSDSQPTPVIRPVHNKVINCLSGVVLLTILDIRDLITLHR